MKIVDRKTFLAMPSGTLFSKYEPCVFEPLSIKGDTLDHCNDFLLQSIDSAIKCTGSGDFSRLLDISQETGSSVPMDFNAMERDGCFDGDQLFAVWESADLSALINRLITAYVEVLP